MSTCIISPNPTAQGGGGNKSTNSYENDPVRSRQAVVDVNYVWDVLCPSRIQVSTAAYVPCDVEGRRITASKIPYLSLFFSYPGFISKSPGMSASVDSSTSDTSITGLASWMVVRPSILRVGGVYGVCTHMS